MQMVESENHVVNFALSKDFHQLVSLRVRELKGITTSLLFNKIYNKSTSPSKDKLSCTDILIESKISQNLSKTEIISGIHLESGIGKKLTVPVVIGLSSEIEKEITCNIHNDNNKSSSFYIDEKLIKFTPSSISSNELKMISKTLTTSSSSISSSSNSSSLLNTVLQFCDSLDWIDLPIEYSKLPIDATLVFTNWCYDVKTGEKLMLNIGRLKMFDENCKLNTGRKYVQLYNDKSKDNLINLNNSAKISTNEAFLENAINDSSRPQWLNKLTQSKITTLESAKSTFSSDDNDGQLDVNLIIELQKFDIPIVYSDIKYVPITLPVYDPSTSIINYDPTFNEITYTNNKIENGSIDNNLSLIYLNNSAPFDPDQIRGEQMEDPIEQKFRRLERMQHLSPLDKDLKPTLKMRDLLSKIMKKQFFEKMTAKERNMVWRYRWFILNTLIIGNVPGWNNALINFIKCMDWNNEVEVHEFQNILKSVIDNKNMKSSEPSSNTFEPPLNIFINKLQVIDCLELLSSNYKNKMVREMAVQKLKQCTDSELAIFMVQLVQSIKNENLADDSSDYAQVKDKTESLNIDEEDVDMDQQQQKNAVITRSTINSNHTIVSSDYQMIDNVINENNEDTSIVDFIDELINKPKLIKSLNAPYLPSSYIQFLVERSVKNASLTNFFYWSLKVELEEEKLQNKNSNINIDSLVANSQPNDGAMNNGPDNDVVSNLVMNRNRDIGKNIYALTMKMFILKLAQSTNGKAKLYELRRQIELVHKLHDFCFEIKVEHRRETTPMKLQILKAILQEKHKRTIFGSKYESRNILLDDNRYETMIEFPKIAIPLDPTVIVNGTIPEESAVFKSSLNPLKITFKTTQNTKYPIMYKIGDDLRQDQFIIQIITLMEKILQSENMDLKLKPYKILATGSVEGFIQFIPNNSLSHILSKYNNSILSYLQMFNPDPTSHLGVNSQVMDNYVRSCAGYCVVTYILGVGDRHLENLLLSKDGYFFHADFGYILGQDPKPFPPLMKLPIQIIEGMGGLEDINYKKFCQYCYITYITLRKNASLILNLVQLMINTSIPALRTDIENNESEKMELLWKVEEKFMLDMNDEEAVLHFQNLIDSSVNAVLPVVIDRLHNLAQYWRS